MQWSVAEAKQKFSAVLRAAAAEPQQILNRGQVVAATAGHFLPGGCIR